MCLRVLLTFFTAMGEALVEGGTRNLFFSARQCVLDDQRFGGGGWGKVGVRKVGWA